MWTAEKEIRLIRLGARDGSYQPFVLDGKPRNFNLEIKEILGEKENVMPTALAVGKEWIALGLAEGRIVLLDKRTAKVERSLQSGTATALAFTPDERLTGLRRRPDADGGREVRRTERAECAHFHEADGGHG